MAGALVLLWVLMVLGVCWMKAMGVAGMAEVLLALDEVIETLDDTFDCPLKALF